MKKTFCFTVDDNIRFLKEIAEKNYKSIFEHPYLAMYKRLHEDFDLKVQLNSKVIQKSMLSTVHTS